MDPRPTPFDSEDGAPGVPGAPPLASHATFLRSLARNLLFDKSAAGDVAQRALLLALQRERSPGASAQRPPADPQSLRSWLAGVVRNLALQSGREERRRAERERVAARNEATSSAADEVARLELMERVLAAVRRLEPTYRTTVMLRFFDQLKPGAIAKRTGVPVETVRTRLKRGLARMRADLDAHHDGDRAAWGVLLLPTALPAGGGLLGGAVGKVTGSVALHALAVGGIGALAMSSKIKLLIGGVVALAATAVIVQFTRSNDGKPLPRGDASHATALAAPAKAKLAPANAGDATPTTAQRAPEPATAIANDVAGPFVVRGRTLNFAGKPLGHLHVKLSCYDGYETDVKPESTAVVESNGDGSFAWGLPLPRGTVTLKAEAGDADYFGFAASELVFAGDTPAPLDVTLHALDVDVVGRVTGEGDAPLGDAHVMAWTGTESDCDENGEYRLHTASSLGEIFVSASAPGHVGTEERVNVQHGSREKAVTLDFRLRPGGTITGCVRDEEGAPVAGAKVSTHRAWLGKATTGDDGRYELSGIDPQQPEVWIDVAHPDFAHTGAQVTPSGADVVQDFVLSRGATVRGFVFDADGRPARGATVWVGGHPNMAGTPRLLAHDDGSFAFTHVKAGAQKAGAQLTGRPSVEKPVTVPADPPRLDGVELRFSAGHALAGRVQDKAGRPVQGATVMTRRNISDFDVYARTDEKGHFELHAVPDETKTIDTMAAGFEMNTRSDFTLDRDDLVIVLSGAGGLAGTVVDAETGAPLERFRIRLVEPALAAGEMRGSNYEMTWAEPGRTFTNAKGTWSTRGESLPARTVFGIEASADGYAPSYALHVVATESPDPAAFVLRLTRGASVVGTVVDERGAPVAGVNVHLFVGTKPTRGAHNAGVDDPRWNVRTTATGSFAIDGAAAGQGWLLITGADFPVSEDGPFDVPAAGTAPSRTIRLERGGAIDGIAVDGAGRPCANRQVLLFDVRDAGTGALPLATTTGSDGRFRFSGLRAGSLQVSLVVERAFQTVNEMSARVTVAAGATASVRLEAKGDARVHGRILGELDGLDSVVVNLHRVRPLDAQGTADSHGAPDSHGSSEETATDGMLADRGTFAVDGLFDVSSIPAGRYIVSANGCRNQQQGVWSGQTEVEIGAGSATEVTVTLARRR